MQLNQQLRVCPVCQKDDRIEKVSAVFSRETYLGSGTAPTYNLIGITALGQRLAPPPPPIYKSPWGGFSISFLVLLGIGACGAFGALTSGYGGPDPSALGGVIVQLGIAGAIIWYKLYEASRRKTKVESQMPAYRAAYDNWNRLYYCHRDSTIF